MKVKVGGTLFTFGAYNQLQEDNRHSNSEGEEDEEDDEEASAMTQYSVGKPPYLLSADHYSYNREYVLRVFGT